MPPRERRRGAVTREIGNDQGAIGTEFTEASAELLRRAEEPMAQHQRFPTSADEVAKPLTSYRHEPLFHHRKVDVVCRRDPGGQVGVKTGRLVSMASLKPQYGSLRRSVGVQSPGGSPLRS